MWRVVAESTNYLTNKLRNRQQEFAAALIGTQNEEPRWKHCIEVVTDKFPIAIASAYARKYFDETSKAIATLMVEYIREEFKKLLKQVSWMDETTKKIALLKADKMGTHIGYPSELLDEKKIEEYYKNVEVDASKYFESILSLRVFEADLEYKKLRKVVNKTDWESHSKIAEVNAAYSKVENSISKWTLENNWRT
jgi:neprilysin